MKRSDISVWEESRKEQENERERLRQEVLDKLDHALFSLMKLYQWDNIYIFGSVLHMGKFFHTSDIDIAVRGLNKTDLFLFVGELSDLMGRNVDVVCLEECRFADSLISKGVLWKPDKKLSFF